MTIVMKRSIAALLAAHAMAHLAGFAGPWWVLDALPSAPENTALIGDAAMHAMSVLWLLVALAFVVAMFAVLYGHTSWRRITATAALASLALSVVCWPGSLLGVPINVAILLLLPWSRRLPSRRPAALGPTHSVDHRSRSRRALWGNA